MFNIRYSDGHTDRVFVAEKDVEEEAKSLAKYRSKYYKQNVEVLEIVKEQKIIKKGRKRKAVIVAGSSANPGHFGHVKMFIAAKQFIETHLNVEVVKGVMVLAEQEHVNKKKGSPLPFDLRRRFFNLLCKDLNVSDWLSASNESHANCCDFVKRLIYKEQTDHNCAFIENTLKEQKNQSPDQKNQNQDQEEEEKEVLIFEVVGGDLIRERFDDVCRIFIGRDNLKRSTLADNDKTKFMVNDLNKDEEFGVLCAKQKLFANQNIRKWYFLENELGAISSTFIREKIASLLNQNETKGQEIMAELRDCFVKSVRTMLSPVVATEYWFFCQAQLT
jgi:nicotinic acid mononucleotide adenylyltransferase